ncbi:MAG UNVERIFIED_CONTAM: hypothetical protein LVR18_46580 [Planctomycetaceae bacterium]
MRAGREKSAMEAGQRYFVRSPFRFQRAGESGGGHGRELAASVGGGRRAVFLQGLYC